jgi:hypothetical protein
VRSAVKRLRLEHRQNLLDSLAVVIVQQQATDNALLCFEVLGTAMNSAVITIPSRVFDVDPRSGTIEFHAAPGLPGFLVWSVFKHPAAVLSDVAQIIPSPPCPSACRPGCGLL